MFNKINKPYFLDQQGTVYNKPYFLDVTLTSKALFTKVYNYIIQTSEGVKPFTKPPFQEQRLTHFDTGKSSVLNILK